MLENLFQKYITAKNVIFFVITILFLIFVSTIQDIAIMFFASFVIACSLNPLTDKLAPKYGRNKAAAIVLFSGLLIVVAFFAPIFVLAGHEIKTFAVSFPQYMESIREFVGTNSIFNETAAAKVDIGSLISSATGFTSNFINETISIGKNIGSAFVYFVASVIIIYYFMADKDTVRSTFLRLVPSHMRKRAGEIWDTISRKIGGYVVAQIATMASVGVIMTVGLMLIKVDYALLLGLITAVLDIIPVVGPGIALLICIVAAYKSGPIVLTLIGVVFAIAQLAENNFVRPYVFGKFLDLHPLIIYLFLFITAKYMGVIGVIFAPAIAATFVVLIEELYMKNLD